MNGEQLKKNGSADLISQRRRGELVDQVLVTGSGALNAVFAASSSETTSAFRL